MANQKEYELTYEGKKREEDIIAETMSVPLQKVKEFGNVKESEWHNKLIFGDNLQILKHLLKLKKEGKLKNPDGKSGIKLVYIDPPFASQQDFKGSKGQKAYQDKIAGAEFLEFLRRRLVLLKRLLTEDGSIYVHLDWRKSHYIKVLMDEVFRENNFRNEIIWYFGERQLPTATKYNAKHANIFFYSKSKEYIFNMQFKDYDDTYLDSFFKFGYCSECDREQKWYSNKCDKCGTTLEGKCKVCGNKLRRFRRREDSNTYPEGRQYLDESQGVAMDTVWDDIPGTHSAKVRSEMVGYETQKPEQLLERVIKTSSKEGDIVLDCFAGSGTTGAVAEKLDRKWMMIDSSKLAIYTIQKRMLDLNEKIGNKGDDLQPDSFALYNAGVYKDSGFLEKMKEEDYKSFVLELFQAEQKQQELNGLEMDGLLRNRPVFVFSDKKLLTKDFVKELHDTVGSALKNEMYIIVPENRVKFNEDYIRQGDKKYNILRIPYSIIEEIKDKEFERLAQPRSEEEINKTIDQVGFDFIYPPEVECDYYMEEPEKDQLELKDANGIDEDYVIEIKEFNPVQISKDPVDFDNPKEEALSMVMIDKDYNGEYFILDDYVFGDEIVDNDFKVHIEDEDIGEKLMIIYLDVLGNEKKEVVETKTFKD